MLSWEEVRGKFDRLYCSQAADDVLTDKVIDSYQAGLLKLYDYWTGVNTEVTLQGDSL
ncbi:hypothetical protein [Paenibacillus sp. J2TS4]|uniref:hypothetical protein n=1 Tax=Paenibacillus sp. J2TS4 TaxID=2807194 RepID=UPI001B21A5E0|nr:hypothetical protein [Paenibacillus sp. J2TS4]GIP35951.1 hypothetical protein J2TS4_51610 [Paenibacillus sp. J2TS4]